MRIVAVSATSRIHGIGGLEDHLHTLTGELARRGHAVTVLTGRHPDGVPDETVDGVEWVYLDAPPQWRDPAWAPALARELHGQLEAAPADVIHSQSSGGVSLVRRPVPGQPPVVLSLHGNYVSIVQAALRVAAVTPSPRAFARAGLAIARVSQVHFSQGNWHAFRGCEASVPSRSQIRPSSLAHALRRKQVHVVPSGADAHVFRPGDRAEARATLGLPPDADVALCIGRLDRGKGAHFAIEAMAKLPGAVLVLVGDGPLEQEDRALAARLGLGERVLFAGRRSADDVATYLAACDACIFPSLLAEAGPLVVAQAMLTGRPVVGSRTGAVPEMLGEDDRAGILVEPGRPDEIAHALDRLFGDETLRERLGAAGRAAALERMTVETMTDAMLDVYERAISGAAPRSAGR
jgi:glycosyltransferase involved in cell wall biosynthesis